MDSRLIFWGIIAFVAIGFIWSVYKTLHNPELLKRIQEAQRNEQNKTKKK